MLFIVPFWFRKRWSWKPIGRQLFSRRVRDIRHLELSSLSLLLCKSPKNIIRNPNLCMGYDHIHLYRCWPTSERSAPCDVTYCTLQRTCRHRPPGKREICIWRIRNHCIFFNFLPWWQDCLLFRRLVVTQSRRRVPLTRHGSTTMCSCTYQSLQRTHLL
jgi:hypothetical protein